MEVNRTKQQQKEETTTPITESEIRNCTSLSVGSIACREAKTPEQVCSQDPTISGCEPPTPPIEQPQPIAGREVKSHNQESQTMYILTLGKITRDVGEISAEIVDQDNNNEEVEEQVLEEEGVDNAEEEQREPPPAEEEDDVSEIIQNLTPILDSAKNKGLLSMN